MEARRTEIEIKAGGVEVTERFKGRLLSFRYSDSLDGKSDSCELVISDAFGELKRGAIPVRGTNFSFTLRKNNWRGSGSLTLPLGNFELDEVSYSSPPSQTTLKFNSLPNSGGGRGSVKNRSWEQTELAKIAGDIAAESGLKLMYDAEGIEIKRAEQNEPNLQFLQKICRNNGLNLKVTNGRLIVYEVGRYERGSAVTTLTPEMGTIINYKFTAKSAAIYGSARNTYASNGITNWLFDIFGLSGDLLSGLASARVGNSGGEMKLNERVESKKESERLVKARLREENKKEWRANFTVMGAFEFVSGNCFNVAGFGMYDGKYIVENSSHALSSGYVTSFSAYKVGE